MIIADTVTVGLTPTRIVEVTQGDGATVYLFVANGSTIYVGDDEVNSTDGFPLIGATGQTTLTLDGVTKNDVLYGIAAANVDVKVLVRTGGATEPGFGVAP